jgi:AsmA-like C-terminal region
MRRRRRLFFAVLGSFGVLGALIIALKIYLGSAGAARQAATRLEAIYGARVTVGRLDAGWLATTLADVQFYEAGPDPYPAPWAVIPEIQTDISAWDLVRGAANPSHLTLQDPVITLRFDRAGKLLTRFPQRPRVEGAAAIRDIRMAGGKLILRQDNRPEMVITELNADMAPDGDRLTFTGKASEARWGNGTLAGWVNTQSGAWTVTVQVPATPITQAMLNDLPFVGPQVWQEVKANGEVKGELTLRFDPETERVHYRLEFDADKTRLHVAAIDLQSDNSKGHLVIEDGLVQLRDVTGQSAGGTISTGGELDFRGKAERLTFKVAVDKLRLRGLPRKWFQNPLVQKLFDGRLTGTADLIILIEKGVALTRGKGMGIIREARVAEVPTDPIRLILRAEGAGFQISVPPPGGDDKPQGKAAPAKPDPDQPSTLEIDLSMRDADVEQLLKGFDLKLPVPVQGRLTCNAHLTIPLASLGDMKTYRLSGSAGLSWVKIAGVQIEHVQAGLDVRDGVLQLANVTGRLADPAPPAVGPPASGRFEGAARVQLFPAGDLTVHGTFADVPVAQLGRWFAAADGALGGQLSGDVFFRGPLQRLDKPETWQATAHVESDRLTYQDWEVGNVSGACRLQDGVLATTGLTGDLEGLPWRGDGHLDLKPPYPYAVNVHLLPGTAPTRLTEKLGALVSVRGDVSASAALDGTLQPLRVTCGGTAMASAVTLAGLRLDTVRLRWARQGASLRLTDVRVGLYRGQATGEARLPLEATAPGSVDFLFQDIDATDFCKDLSALPLVVTGRTSGTVHAAILPESADGSRSLVLRTDVQARLLRIEGIPTEHVFGSVIRDASAIDYRLRGDALGGRFWLDGHLPAKGETAADAPADGRLRMEGLQLSRLWGALGVKAVLGPLRGGAELDVTYRHAGAERMPLGDGRFALTRLSWGDVELAQQVGGDISLADRELRIRDINGGLGQGFVRGWAVYNFAQPGRSQFGVTLENADVGRLLAPWPAVASHTEGTLDVHISGTLGPEWRGNGDVVLAHGALGGVDIAHWRVPFDFTLVPGERRGQIEVRETSAQVALGQVSGKASLGWGVGARTEGTLRFYNVELRSLLRSFGESSPIGAGHLSGRLDFAASDISAPENYSATLDASLQQAQALQLPVLQQLAPVLLPGQSSSAVFQTGDITARLQRGVITIQRFRLVGTVLQLILQGTATLEGRLNLEATANTGGLVANAPFIGGLAAGMPDNSPLPFALLSQATRLLSVRLVHLRIGGTLRAPIVQQDTLTVLTEEALRFFVGWARQRR